VELPENANEALRRSAREAVKTGCLWSATSTAALGSRVVFDGITPKRKRERPAGEGCGSLVSPPLVV
jgi:hypothetical protein